VSLLWQILLRGPGRLKRWLFGWLPRRRAATAAAQSVDQALAQIENSAALAYAAHQSIRDVDTQLRTLERQLGVVDAIAFQIRMLALNASIEATRAGDAGRRFARIAGGLQNFGHQFTECARDIRTALNALRQGVLAGDPALQMLQASLREAAHTLHQSSDSLIQFRRQSALHSDPAHGLGSAWDRLQHEASSDSGLLAQSLSAGQSLGRQAEELVGVVTYFRSDPGAVEKSLGLAARNQAHRKEAAELARASRPSCVAPDGRRVYLERRGPDRARNVLRPRFGKARTAAAPHLPESGSEVEPER